MVVTFRQLIDQCLRHLDEPDDTTSEALAKDYINQAHQQRCMQAAWPWMLTPVQTFTTEDGRNTYSLDHRYSRPLYLYNRTTNRYLQEVPKRQVRDDTLFRWNTETGSARNFMLWGNSTVRNQPTSASVVTIVSSASSDTGSDYTVAVKGLDSNGNELADVITASGTTSVPGATSFVEITGITKSGSWNGNLTVTTNSGAVTNLVLMPWEMGRQYPQVFIVEEPTSAETIEHRGYKHPEWLINDYDIPDIPGPLAQILVYDALMMFSTYNADSAGGELTIWAEQRDRWERSLNATLLEGNTLAAHTEHIHPDPDDMDDWFGF